MRKDMPQLLCERPRFGGTHANKKGVRRRNNNPNNFEEAPRQQSTSRGRLYGYNCKELNEYLNPLARFLESRVGKPWDDVYSELREHLRIDKAVHLHIMQHLWQYVERHTAVSDCGTIVYLPQYTGGGPYAVNGKLGWQAVKNRGWSRSTDLYVHPVTGILCDANKGVERRRYRYRDPDAKNKHRFGHRHFVRKEGIWYEYDIVPLPKGVKWGEQVLENQSHVEARWYVSKYRPEKAPRLIEAGHFDVTYGVEDIFFGPTGGKKVWGKLALPDLRKVKNWYGSLKVYCPGTYKQVDSKTLRKVGLKKHS